MPHLHSYSCGHALMRRHPSENHHLHCTCLFLPPACHVCSQIQLLLPKRRPAASCGIATGWWAAASPLREPHADVRVGGLAGCADTSRGRGRQAWPAASRGAADVRYSDARLAGCGEPATSQGVRTADQRCSDPLPSSLAALMLTSWPSR
jgi:hypothetical protein